MQAKKSLGQHFLTSEAALYSIITASNIVPGEKVLEIGPGKGVLTKNLLDAGALVLAVEKDYRLIPVLEELFKEPLKNGQLGLVHDDILAFLPEKYGFTAGNYKLIANIPYYITGELLRKFLETDNQPSHMTLLVQKEVAERIIARDSKESLLSLSVKAYGTPKYIQTVKAGSFTPAPTIDSAILTIENISKSFFANISEEKFFTLIKAGFAHKRKLLTGNLKEKGLIEESQIDSVFSKANIPRNARAEDLTLAQWQKLCFSLFSL